MSQADIVRSFTCYAPLASGELTEVTATANLLRGHSVDLAAIKVEGAKLIAAALKDVVAQARLTEPSNDERWRLYFHLEPCPSADDRGWELAVVIADRGARGLLPPAVGRVLALGCSDRWDLGRVEPLPGSAQAARLNSLGRRSQAGDLCILALPTDDLGHSELETLEATAEVQRISHLGGLLGHPDPAQGSRGARAWFPLVSGDRAQDRLAWVEVTVLAGDPQGPVGPIAFSGNLPKHHADRGREVLTAARDLDGKPGHWRTSVRFGQHGFSDNSWELALVMADRIARGRDLPAAGRLIATGCSSRWSQGRVERVGGTDDKCRLFLDQAAPGDRILIPAAWRDDLPMGLAQSLASRGASLGILDRLV